MVNKKTINHSKIRDFILENVESHPKDISKFTADHFNVSRQAVLLHINSLHDDRLLKIEGKTKDRKYSLLPVSHEVFHLPVSENKEEDVVWRKLIRPKLAINNKNVITIWEYGFTEMYNNVIEHSSADTVTIYLDIHKTKVDMIISDDGVGIFNKIQKDCGLDDRRHAIFELSKGKLTTDPQGHTGEGIFFTSRMFDKYAILSSEFFFTHDEPGDDWLLQREAPNGDKKQGTSILMTISNSSTRSTKEVFDKYTSKGSYGFDRTHVPVSLSLYGDENLVSRSQAKRILARFDRFKEVFLNFKGVDMIGQAFADEIFRVFHEENPNVKIVYVYANNQVKRMIRRVKAQRELQIPMF